jgi:hypothetical protein
MKTTVLENILGRVGEWSPEAQEELVRFVLEIEQRNAHADDLTDEDWKIIDERVEAARRGEIATDEEVAALFGKYRLA